VGTVLHVWGWEAALGIAREVAAQVR